MKVQKIVRIEGTALPMRGNDIDTDRIMPARYLRAVTFDGLERYLFEDERKGSAAGSFRRLTERSSLRRPFRPASASTQRIGRSRSSSTA